MDAKVLHIIAAVLSVLCWIFQIVAMAGSTAMWSSDFKSKDKDVAKSEGCGLFSCSGPAVCSCIATGCVGCPKTCPDSVTEGHCQDLAGHVSVAQAFAVVGILALSFACILCILKLTPLAKKIPEGCMSTLQCAHIATAILCLITFALIAAAYDKEFCGCAVKDMESSLSYGFAFFVINMVFQIICAVLAGASQAMEGGGTGDYNSYSS